MKKNVITKVFILLNVLGCSITAQTSAQNSNQMSRFHYGLEIIDRYIAIDNVCAWPNLTLMPDSSIIATIYNQPTHGTTEGDVECWVSTDGGKIWKYRGTPAKHDPGTNRMNITAGLAHNGDLIVIAFGWSNRAPMGEPQPKEKGQGLYPWVSRSSDGGRTWEVSKSAIKMPPGKTNVVPFGNIVKVSKNKLAAPFYSGWDSYVLFSNDDGRTWGVENALIAKDCCGEPSILPLKNKRWLAITRTHPDHVADSVVSLGENLLCFVSEDEGQNWKETYHLTGATNNPGNLLQLADGRILITYGDRRAPSPSIEILISDDEGRSWKYLGRDIVSLHGMFIGPSGFGDMGYPSTIC